jgi:hypothetical protein
VNEDLENLDHTLTKRLHSTYINVYHRMFKDTYHELKEEMTENYGNSAVKDIDEECLNNIFSSAVGSMFDWTAIDPKSVGMGSIDHISELFQKYYYGEVNDNGPRPWEEIRSDYRKYGANQHLEIQGDKFYNDFINGFFFRSCVKGYVSKETRAPTDFKSKVEGFYDFNPELWFDNKDTANPTKFKLENKHDSYGNFFKVRQPIRIAEAIFADGAGLNNDPRNLASYPAAHPWATAVANADQQINNYTGIYDTNLANATHNYILTNEEKMVCCLFHYAAMRNQEYLTNNTLVQRLTNPTRPLESLDFDSANQVLFGIGTDRGIDANSALDGQNAPINKAIQLLYNSQSLGFHVTHGVVGGIAHSSTLLALNGKNNVQMITGYSCGVGTTAAAYVSVALAAATYFSDGQGAVGGIAATSVQLFTTAGAPPYIGNVTATFSKNRYEYIPINQIIRGGSSKYKKQKISKVISKKKLLKKEKKSNPVKKVKKVKKYVQKGGARNNFFDITQTEPNGLNISLSAKRREETLTKPIFENYRKAIKEYIKRFGKSMSATKINDDIREKLHAIFHLGIFYHDNNKTLDFGGLAATPNTGAPNPLRIEQIGEIFLFCSVISNTIKLMIHFFNNIKACINHFINSELQEIKKGINKQLRVVNSTNISSLNASYFDKYIDGCTNLIKNIDELVNFLRNNTLCLGKPISTGLSGSGAADPGFTENEQNIINLFFGANVARQFGTKQAGGLGMGAYNLQTVYPTEFFTFNHSIIDFFSNNGKYDFTHLNISKFHETLRRLTGNQIELNNGFPLKNTVTPNTFPKEDYSITKASFGGIPFTFQDDKSTQYSWMTYRLLLLWREKSNDKLSDEVVGEINQSLSQIKSQDKIDIKKKVIETYKDVRPILADPKIDLGSKNKVLQKVFFSFFENSNTIAKKIIDEHLAIEKKSKRINVRSKTSISNIVQRRHLGPLESGRVLIPDEIKIQQEMRKFSYKVDCLINLLHVILISKTHPTIKNYIIFMYSISRLRNFVYRLYYLNKTYYTENEQAKKKLLEDSGFSLSKNSKQNTKKTFETFSKLNSFQLKDPNSGSEDWWVAMEKSFRDRTTEIHGIYYRLYTYVLMDGEIYLVDIFSMAKSTHSVKSNKEIMKKDVAVYRDHSGDEIYSPENMFIKLVTDLSKDTTYRKLLNGELHYEYTKTGSRDKKKKILEPLFIQGSTVNQLRDIVKDNYYVPAARGRPDIFVASRNPETSFQLYKIQKHFVLHASAFRSWAYQLLFSMPTRIDVDDSFFKLHIQTPINSIPSLAKSQLEPSLKHISNMNQQNPMIEFKSKVRVNNNSKLMLGNNINNKRIESFTKYISREQLILLGLVFGDTLN